MHVFSGLNAFAITSFMFMFTFTFEPSPSSLSPQQINRPCTLW
jgi:hypothetical protein